MPVPQTLGVAIAGVVVAAAADFGVAVAGAADKVVASGGTVADPRLGVIELVPDATMAGFGVAIGVAAAMVQVEPCSICATAAAQAPAVAGLSVMLRLPEESSILHNPT